MNKVVLIFGASSGIGFESAKLFLQQGYIVLNCSRGQAQDNRIKNYQVDVSNSSTIDVAIESILKEYGRIDIMIYSAGFSMATPISQVNEEDYRYLFDVNVNGAIYAIKKVVPIMKEQNAGRIVLISSLASTAPIPFDPYYCASKAAINALTVALATELDRYNIVICSVLPGGVKTNFTDMRKVYQADDNSLKNAVANLSAQEQKGMSAEAVAKRVYKSATEKRPPLLAVAGCKNKILYFFCKILPLRLLKRASQGIFGVQK